MADYAHAAFHARAAVFDGGPFDGWTASIGLSSSAVDGADHQAHLLLSAPRDAIAGREPQEHTYGVFANGPGYDVLNLAAGPGGSMAAAVHWWRSHRWEPHLLRNQTLYEVDAKEGMLAAEFEQHLWGRFPSSTARALAGDLFTAIRDGQVTDETGRLALSTAGRDVLQPSRPVRLGSDFYAHWARHPDKIPRFPSAIDRPTVTLAAARASFGAKAVSTPGPGRSTHPSSTAARHHQGRSR